MALTPDKNFRMNASTKTYLALGNFKNAHDRGEFKRAMIEAQLCEEAARRAAMKSRDASENKGKGRGAVAPE